MELKSTSTLGKEKTNNLILLHFSDENYIKFEPLIFEDDPLLLHTIFKT